MNPTVRILLALVMAAAWAAAATEPEFDQGVDSAPALAEAQRRAAAMASPEGAPQDSAGEGPEVWISVGKEDIAPAAAGFPLSNPIMASERAAVYRVRESRLSEISAYMHEKHRKCGGFFAHSSQAEAAGDLKPPVGASGGSYTLDERQAIPPLVAAVREAEIVATINTLAAFQNRYYQADTGVASAQWIATRWRELAKGLSGSSVELFSHSGWKQPSVILTIPGSEPGEAVVLGGHLDSISGWRGSAGARAPGADDNASGIAVLTEAIRVLSEGKFRPRRTLHFMGYAAEEVGLRGSKEIAESFKNRGVKVAGVIQYDMTNFKGSATEVFLLGDNTDSALTAYLGKLLDEYVKVSWGTTKCGYACSDHASWTRAGFAASAAFEASMQEMNNALHTERDTLATSGGDASHSVPFAKLAVAYAVETAKSAAAQNAAAHALERNSRSSAVRGRIPGPAGSR